MGTDKDYRNLGDYKELQDRIAALRQNLAHQLSSDLIQHPELAVNSHIAKLHQYGRSAAPYHYQCHE